MTSETSPVFNITYTQAPRTIIDATELSPNMREQHARSKMPRPYKPSDKPRRSVYFSPSILMVSAVDVVWFVALPQTTPVPQTTLKPLLELEPQQTLLPQSTDVPFTNTFVPQTTEASQTASVPQTTLVPVSKETLCVVGSKTAVGDTAEAPARSLLDSAAAISR